MGFIAVGTQIGRYLLHKVSMLMTYLLITVMASLLAISATDITTHGIIISWII